MREYTFRNKIFWFTFCFSILVIWVHSYNAELFLGRTAAAAIIEDLERFLGDTVAQIAVPGFFMISSYLFFRNFTMSKLWMKWSSRIRSVLVPYIVWNVIYYFGYAAGSRIPIISGIIGKGKIPVSLPALTDAIVNYTYNYVFWYLYQLIILILLAPVIYILVKRTWVGIFYLVGILTAIFLGASLPQLNLDALFYYSFAAFAAVHGRRIMEGKWNWKRAAAGVGAVALGIFLSMLEIPASGAGGAAAGAVMLRFLCPAGLWLLWPDSLIPKARTWMKNNFFLYAVHFAMVRLINKTGALLLPSIPWIPLGLYLLMPVFIVFLSDRLGCFLRKACSPVWRLLNGGR